MSVLGRDILELFAVIVDRSNKRCVDYWPAARISN